MVEAESHLKLPPASILDIYKVFELIDMLSIDTVAAIHSYIHRTWLRFWGSGIVCGVKMMSLHHG